MPFFFSINLNLSLAAFECCEMHNISKSVHFLGCLVTSLELVKNGFEFPGSCSGLSDIPELRVLLPEEEAYGQQRA